MASNQRLLREVAWLIDLVVTLMMVVE